MRDKRRGMLPGHGKGLKVIRRRLWLGLREKTSMGGGGGRGGRREGGRRIIRGR